MHHAVLGLLGLLGSIFFRRFPQSTLIKPFLGEFGVQVFRSMFNGCELADRILLAFCQVT